MLKIIKKLFKQKNIKEQITYDCIKSDTTIIHEEARINNLLGDINSIKFGKNTHIRGEFYTFPSGGSIEIGDYCYIGENTRIWSAKNIKIGNRVLIAHDVNVFDHFTHPLDPKERHEHYKQIISVGFPKISLNLGEEPVFIEDDVWIGAKSIILPGITIGKGAIVGAGSVVTKNVEPYTIVAGNPAQFIKNVQLSERRG